jgi:hypothetical protein
MILPLPIGRIFPGVRGEQVAQKEKQAGIT